MEARLTYVAPDFIQAGSEHRSCSFPPVNWSPSTRDWYDRFGSVDRVLRQHGDQHQVEAISPHVRRMQSGIH